MDPAQDRVVRRRAAVDAGHGREDISAARPALGSTGT